MAIIAKRTIMSLYSDAGDIYSHQIRLVLSEKGVNVDVIPVRKSELPEDLIALNPYGTLPTLVDRELVLYDTKIMMEYLDERYPHPSLLPVYPVARAESRKMIYRIERDLYSLMHRIVDNKDANAREALAASLNQLEPVFADKPYFLSEEFSLLDCVLAPMLWRLPMMGVIIDKSSVHLQDYMARMFNRDSFQSSLTEVEKQQRVA